MSKNIKLSNSQSEILSNSQKNIISKNSTHLIDDKSDDEDDIISWEDLDSDDDQFNEDMDEGDEIIVDDKDYEEKGVCNPEIIFDVIDKNNEKSVKISINLEEASKVVNIEFCITKEIF